MFTQPNKEKVISDFVKNFVTKEHKDRAILELNNEKKRYKFIDRLNHNWANQLDMRHLVRIDSSNDYAIAIQKLLKFKEDEVCYIISNYDEFDDKFMLFKEIFDKIYTKGLATIILNVKATTLFLDTEQESGAAARFIGSRN